MSLGYSFPFVSFVNCAVSLKKEGEGRCLWDFMRTFAASFKTTKYMKTSVKRFAGLALLMVALQVQADDVTFPFLVLTTSNGQQTALAVEQLEMTFEDGKLVAKNANGQATFDLADLATMQFSESNTGIVDGVESVRKGGDSEVSAYDMSGRPVNGPLRKGVYVVRKADGSTSKILVK